MFWDQFDAEHLIAAHRGYRAIRPENTMAAFEAAVGRCDFVELDVGFSRDGVPIIIHDDTLERTSNVTEVAGFSPPYNVIDYSYSELLKLDFSSWFAAVDPFGTIASGVVSRETLASLPVQQIPTLEEVLSYLHDHYIAVNIEIKDMKNTAFDTVAVSKVLSVIQTLEMEDEILLSSFNHHYIMQSKTIAPHISSAFLQEEAHPDNLVTYLKDLDIECYHCDIAIVTEALVRKLTKAGIMVNVFTVNTPKEKERMYRYGVKAIFTDFLA